MTARVLVVEDDPDIRELLRFHFARESFLVDEASSGREAALALDRNLPDIVILDLMLPDCSGTEICRDLRAREDRAHLPVIMLTARSDEVDRVVGLELGADDYVTKPFSPRELVLRVRAVLRRTREASPDRDPILRLGPLSLDRARHRCKVSGHEVDLTAKEFGLLEALMQRPGRVFTRDQLVDAVWGPEFQVTLRTIDTHLKRLRMKLGAAGDLVETVRGVGYRFAEPRLRPDDTCPDSS